MLTPTFGCPSEVLVVSQSAICSLLLILAPTPQGIETLSLTHLQGDTLSLPLGYFVPL